jgi:uncharacterized protein YegL
MTERERTRRNLQIALLTGLLATTAWLAHAMEQTSTPQQIDRPLVADVRPRIEVAFVLDTTGSMSGLIEGAKQKIWSVANQLADGQPKPEIRVGLIAYRDRGDAYVTKRFDLTADIDSIYRELYAFRADGGGDGPESVNQALHDAVTQLDWSDSQNVYKVVFLVGDAPPHMDYANDVKYPESLRLARAKGIVVNTIQCGALPGTQTVWKEIARSGEGEFAAISQDGGMVAMATPMDESLARLNRDLADTALAYGDAEEKVEIEEKLRSASAAPASVLAARLSYLGKMGADLISGRRDLVGAVEAGDVDLAELPKESLPAPMQAMEPEKREAYVAEKLAERKSVQRQIDVLTQERDAYVRAETGRLKASGKADGFDAKVLETIREQAAVAGIEYE